MVNILDGVSVLLVGREVEPKIRRSQFFLSVAAEEAKKWAVNCVSSFGS